MLSNVVSLLRLSRVFVGVYMLVTGIARMVTGNTPASINIFSARAYGLIMVLGAIFLLATATRWRCHWLGRLAAITCAAIWMLIIANAWPSLAWVSISGACMYVLMLSVEVVVHEC